MRFKAFTGLSGLGTLAAAIPSQCAVCHAWPSQRVCQACTARFAQPVPRCTRCALRVPEGVAVCGACLKAPPLYDLGLAAVDYAYPWSGIVAEFKFRADPGWAGTLAALVRSAPGVQPALDQADLVLPIPLSAERLRERGFNQAWLLARGMAPGKAHAAMLLRLHAADTQARLTRAQRLRNLRGAFMVEPSQAAALRGRHVALIDDVMTTGATLEAATMALREAGVASVSAIVMARTEPGAGSSSSSNSITPLA